MNDLFDTQAKRESAVALFKELIAHPGWQLHCQIIDANIAILTEQILNRGAEQTEAMIDRFRDKRTVLLEERNSPQNMIKQFESTEDEEINLDPFEDVSESTTVDKSE